MGLLYELEEQFEGTVREHLEQALQEALDYYKPMCKECNLDMHRHHTYSRNILTRHGELDLIIPVFRCGECGDMHSASKVIGEEESRKHYSKKHGKQRAGIVGLELCEGG